MANRRFDIPGGKFKTYEEAAKFKEDQLIIQEALDVNSESQIQIRRRENGYAVVLRKEV